MTPASWCWTRTASDRRCRSRSAIKPADAVTGKRATRRIRSRSTTMTPPSVIAPHGFSFLFIQACIAILLLVGFESVTAMGEEAKNPKKDIRRAVLLSLAIQGAVCYLFEYFARELLPQQRLHHVQRRRFRRAARRHDDASSARGLFGSASAGKAFMLVQAVTVFLALIGTTLSCINTGARVTYAMGRDEEVRPISAWCTARRSRPTRHLDAGGHLHRHRHRDGGDVPGRAQRPAPWTRHKSGTASASSRPRLRQAAQHAGASSR